MPFASDDTIDIIESNIKGMSSVTQLISDGKTAEDISLMALEGLNPNVLDDFEVSYKCDCSRQRVEKALISLGKSELESMSNDDNTEVCCHFCDKKYNFSSEQIKNLLKTLDK